MTVVNPKSISGITSITTASGSDNLLTIHTSDASNTERLRIDSTGATKIVTGIVTTLTATTGIVTTLTSNTTTLNSTTTATGNINVSGANITLQDSGGGSDDRLVFGAGSDLSIYHNGSASYIEDSGTGELILKSNSLSLTNAAETEYLARFFENGAAELYYDSSKRIETHTQGAAIASGGMTMPTMNSFSSQILVGASGFIGNYHDGTTNQQLIVGTNQYYDSGYKSRTNTTASQLQFYDRSFRFNTAAAPGSAGGALTQVQALRIDTDGVKFGTDTAAANALDDYEEGSFTPTVLVNSSDSGIVYTNQYGKYVKVGRQVSVNLYVSISNKGSGTGLVHFGGLPFQVADDLTNTQHEASGSVGYVSGLGTNAIFFTVTAVPSPNALMFTLLSSAQSATAHATQAHLSGTFGMRCSCTYFTNEQTIRYVYKLTRLNLF